LWYLVWDGELLFSKVMPRPFETELACEVKSYDVDFVGYVHNAVYLRWLEDLRTAMLAAYYPLERFAHQGQSPILTRTTMQYKKPLQLFDRFTGRVWATQLAGVRWEMSHELIHNGQIAAIAEQSGMFINLNTHRPVAVPPELLHKFQEFQSP
jgi:acyl-CoA thioester hydrolase